MLPCRFGSLAEARIGQGGRKVALSTNSGQSKIGFTPKQSSFRLLGGTGGLPGSWLSSSESEFRKAGARTGVHLAYSECIFLLKSNPL